MSEVASKAKLSINYSGGNKRLKRMKTCKVKFDADSEVILAIGVTGGAGFRDKEGGGEITADVYQEDGVPEVDYFKLWATKERFGFVLKVGDDGDRFQFRTVKVTTPPEIGVDDQGNNMLSVTMKFLQFGQI